jgi:hypothetical protein
MKFPHFWLFMLSYRLSRVTFLKFVEFCRRYNQPGKRYSSSDSTKTKIKCKIYCAFQWKKYKSIKTNYPIVLLLKVFKDFSKLSIINSKTDPYAISVPLLNFWKVAKPFKVPLMFVLIFQVTDALNLHYSYS